jgi:hypothetical protein
MRAISGTPGQSFVAETEKHYNYFGNLERDLDSSLSDQTQKSARFVGCVAA